LSFFPGRRLGGGAESYPRRQPQAPATRSWGYGPPQDLPFPPSPLDDTPSDYTEYSSSTTHVIDDDPDLAEAIRRSHASYRAETAGSDRYTPSAPPYYPEEDEEGEGVMYPDLVGERPPLYPANPGPPPLRGGWRLPTPQPRFDLHTILYWVIGIILGYMKRIQEGQACHRKKNMFLVLESWIFSLNHMYGRRQTLHTPFNFKAEYK
jgi:hypothetical protein